jgi:hypothetical protein
MFLHLHTLKCQDALFLATETGIEGMPLRRRGRQYNEEWIP